MYCRSAWRNPRLWHWTVEYATIATSF